MKKKMGKIVKIYNKFSKTFYLENTQKFSNILSY